MSKKEKTPKEIALENVTEVDNIEDLNKKIKELQFAKGDPNIVPIENYNNYYIKNNMFYNAKTNERLYPSKPEWAEMEIIENKDGETYNIKNLEEHLENEVLDQENCNFINHVIYHKVTNE